MLSNTLVYDLILDNNFIKIVITIYNTYQINYIDNLNMFVSDRVIYIIDNLTKPVVSEAN